jgi:glycosyltransferase involved in cell wall biosynthesis
VIVQVGPYPPPLGGVSTYIRRLKHRLDGLGLPNEVWDTSSGTKADPGVRHRDVKAVPWWHLLRRDVRLVHYNISGMRAKRYVALFNRTLLRGRPTVLTLHGDASGLLALERARVVPALDSFGAVIAVREGDRETLARLGVRTMVAEIPAFAPPLPSETDPALVPAAVGRFLDTHHPVLSANAFRIAFHEGVDLYGLDMCVELCADLKETHPRVGFVFCIPEAGSEEYLREIRSRIVARGVEPNFLVVNEPLPLCPILQRSDLFVRPTNTDGDAVSVREALYLRVPALASDVVPRPRGTRLFRTRDAADLRRRALEILGDPEGERAALSRIEVPDNLGRILDVYRRLGALD